MALEITEVEVINVYPKLAARYEHRLQDYYTIDHRDFIKVSTSAGAVGWERIERGRSRTSQRASSIILLG